MCLLTMRRKGGVISYIVITRNFKMQFVIVVFFFYFFLNVKSCFLGLFLKLDWFFCFYSFDHHVDRHNMLSSNESLHWADADRAMAKRQKVDVKLENDEVNDNYSFPEHTHTYRDTTT